MTNFEYALKEVLNIEGGYVNNKYDKGGKTKFGITENLAKKYNYDVETISKDQAIYIYKKEFWDKLHLDLIKNKDIAKEVFEFAINAGNKIAVKVLQRSYNALNFDIIKEDGILGKITASKINNYKYPKILLKTQNILQGYYYILLAEGDKQQLKEFKNHKERKGTNNKYFIKGWLNKRIQL